MFHVQCFHGVITKDAFHEYSCLGSAIDAARSAAMYGAWNTVKVYDKDWNPLVLFSAKEMRHASQRQREARELQVTAGVHGGL
jgi:hypothetical protein